MEKSLFLFFLSQNLTTKIPSFNKPRNKLIIEKIINTVNN